MIRQEQSVLLYAPGEWGDELAARLGRQYVLRVSEPYQALELLASSDWSTVVLGYDQPDCDDLCRAARQIVPSSRLLAICDVSQEPQVRSLRPDIIDDYFIYPPTLSELEEVRAGLAVVEPVAKAAAFSGQGLLIREQASLIESATSLASLESAVAELVAARSGLAVRWTDASRVTSDQQVLVMLSEAPARALVPRESDKSTESVSELLEDLRQCLPALATSARRAESLQRLAITDHLTGLYNRRYFYLMTDQILARSQGSGARVTLLLYDIDNFKHYNDTYGYAAGDEILRETAGLMRKISRTQDLVARIGGDEFAVLFWDQGQPRVARSRRLESAAELAERFRRAVSQHRFSLLGPEAKGVLSISGGLAHFPADGANVRELLRSADKALKQAKKDGKNGIRIAGV